ncbi:UNVERIFIED_CONTAM: hypothetical protein FKN15_044177 [Acipenser sinensis]
MEVFNEAVEYLLGYGIPVVEDDQLDLEDVFDGECDNGFLSAVDSPFSPVRTESADFGDGLVSNPKAPAVEQSSGNLDVSKELSEVGKHIGVA